MVAPIDRVRQICLAMPGATERVSHGEPTFFVGKKVFTMFANNHHGDGRIAVWLPAPAGLQSVLIDSNNRAYFKPPYVGVRGWVGVELGEIDNDGLRFHIQTAWELIAPKKLLAQTRASQKEKR